MSVPYYPHQLDVLLAADPRLRATIEEMAGKNEVDTQAFYESGLEDGRNDDSGPAAERASKEGAKDALERVRAALDDALDQLDVDDDVLAKIAVMIEGVMDDVAGDFRDQHPDKDALDAARKAAAGFIVRFSSKHFEVHQEDANGTAVLVKGEGMFYNARATQFRTADAARTAAARQRMWNLPVVEAPAGARNEAAA